MIYDTVGGRKFLLTISSQVISTGLLYVEKLTPTSYESIIIWTVAAYIAGNSYQKVKTPKDN